MDVHARAALGVGAAERDLQRGEVDDVRDLVLVERAAHRRPVRHVPRHERHARALLLRKHESQTGVVGAEVEPDRLLASVEERLQRPGAEAPERTRDERAAGFRQVARPGRR